MLSFGEWIQQEGIDMGPQLAKALTDVISKSVEDKVNQELEKKERDKQKLITPPGTKPQPRVGQAGQAPAQDLQNKVALAVQAALKQ